MSDFEAVFKTYYRQLYLYAYGFITNEMDAEDIVQGAFSVIWEKRNSLPEQLDIKAYLYTCVKHACLRYFQRLKLTDQYKQRQAEALLLSFANDVEDDHEIVTLVQNAMKSLSPQQMRIIELHIMKGLKYTEIAACLGLSENTVRTHLKRAYKVLRQQLACLSFTIPVFLNLD